MGNPKTPNIGLNKIDRTSPATTYFDLEKYIDQNADSIDKFAGEVNEAITGVTDVTQRFDVEKHIEVVLNAGMEILNAERSAAFSLDGIKGRTLVNLLGRTGNFETDSNGDGVADGWAKSTEGTVTLETINEGLGTKAQRIAVLTSDTNLYSRRIQMLDAVTLIPGKKYIAVVNADTDGVSTATLRIINKETGLDLPGVPSTGTTSKKTMYIKATVTEERLVRLFLYNLSPLGATGWVQFDGAGIYEVSDELYNRIGVDINESNIRDYFPYVDSVQPVRNPYAIRYGENLLPPFYEWSAGYQVFTVISPYVAKRDATGSGAAALSPKIRTVPGQTYTLSYKVNNGSIAYMNIQWLDDQGNSLGFTPQNNGGQTVISPIDAAYMIILATSTAEGTFIFENPMLTLGTTTKPFKPREDAMLALQTDLYADPLTGEKADEVFEKDGQYFKLTKWKKVVLDGGLSWEFVGNIGVKTMKIFRAPMTGGISEQQIVTKFNGNMLENTTGGSWPSGDKTDLTDKYIYISIYNTDSGWGENYTPDTTEIKAYFMGWKIYQEGSRTTPYTSGLKQWYKINKENESSVSILPTSSYAEWAPYQLVYQLATPTVEPIVSEGMLTFYEGDNQVEVGTGLVLRERVNPLLYSPNGNYYVNNTALSGSLLKNRVSSIFQVCRDGRIDNSAKIENDANAYGKQHIRFLPSDFDPAAAYSVTYLMLDKSPIVPFTGSYAANEKAMLQELTDSVQQNATAVAATDRAVNDARLGVINSVKSHLDTIATSENGAHGLRVIDGNLEYYNGSDWIRIVRDNPFTKRVRLHVDNINGNDNNDGLTEATAFKTIKGAVNKAVKYYGDIVWIHCATTVSEKIELKNITNLNLLSISGVKYGESGGLAYPMAKTPQITISGCTSEISVNNFEVDKNLEGYEYGITVIERCSRVFIGAVRNINVGGNPAFQVASTTYAAVSTCEVSNRGTVLEAHFGGLASTYNLIGTNNSVGLKARLGATIFKQGTQASATTAEVVNDGGVIK